VALIAIRLYIGCPIIGYDLQDTIWVLSRAEQIVEGQVPHCDYFAFQGPAPFLLIAGGILLVGCRGLAITVAFVLLTPVAVAAGWFLSRTRLSAVMAASFSFMLGVQLLSTAGPGGINGSHAMIYNRFGWVVLSIVAIQSLVPPRDGPALRRTVVERTVLGIALACLAFTKLNYFAAGILSFGAGCVLFPQTRRGIIGAIIGFLAGTLFFAAFLRFDLLAYCRNVLVICGAVSPDSRYEVLLQIVWRNVLFIALACIPLSLVLKQMVSRAVQERRLTESARIAAGALSLLLLGMIVCSMNHQNLCIPLSVLAAGAMCEAALREGSSASPAARAAVASNPRYIIGCMAALASFLPVIALDLAAIGLSLQWKAFLNSHPAEDAVLHSTILKDFVCPALRGQVTDREEVTQALLGGGIRTPHYMTAYMNEGIDLVIPYVGPADRVFCMDKLNLFPLALGIPYAAGDTGEHTLPTKEGYPSADQTLRDVTLIMEPKIAFHDFTRDFFQELFASVMSAKFEKVSESRFWIVWRRRADRETMTVAR
jgi:hypothetical protein